MSNSSNKFIEGFLAGGVLGFLGALFFAPKSGAELRKDIKDRQEELYKQASGSVSDLKDRTEQALQDFQTRSDTLLKQASSQLQETKDRLTSKFQEVSGNKTKVLIQDQNKHV